MEALNVKREMVWFQPEAPRMVVKVHNVHNVHNHFHVNVSRPRTHSPPQGPHIILCKPKVRPRPHKTPMVEDPDEDFYEDHQTTHVVARWT